MRSAISIVDEQRHQLSLFVKIDVDTVDVVDEFAEDGW